MVKLKRNHPTDIGNVTLIEILYHLIHLLGLTQIVIELITDSSLNFSKPTKRTDKKNPLILIINNIDNKGKKKYRLSLHKSYVNRPMMMMRMMMVVMMMMLIKEASFLKAFVNLPD